jgi:FAD:protein FMN transferase
MLRLFACTALLLAGCEKPPAEPAPTAPPARHVARFDALGTVVRMVVVGADEEAAAVMFAAARRSVESVGASMSTFDPQSGVSQLNARGAAELTPDTLTVIAEARKFWIGSNGAFDITYAPLRALWREAAQRGRVPDDAELAAARALVGMEKLTVDGRQARFDAPGMKIDLGGIAKGYAIDLAARALQDAGAAAGLVDIGGDICVFGAPAARPLWHLQVRPVEGGPKEPIILALTDCAVATSGDYERGFVVGKEWFSHIIDPRTGRPVENATSVTVVAPDATAADALATAMSVLTPDAAIAVANALPGVECLLMHRDAAQEIQLLMSKGFADLVVGD